ncbi:MAG: 5-methylcytosine-specific restriction enzyme B [Chloroflexi bacterium ADurb.Bin325]|nr:MAG: 5-methylcytosine-specific restriction enzyme B [Chloroflexi bacterium ADurb.Bin325]
MTSKYDTYWQDRLGAILALFDQAQTAGKISPLSLIDLDALGERSSWYGKLEIVTGQSVYDSAAHLAALGAVLTPRLPKWAEEGAWTVAVSKELLLTVEKADAQKTNWFENAYRNAKQAETITRAEAYLGPLTQDAASSGWCRTSTGKRVYVLFTTQRDRWLAPRRTRLEDTAAAGGDIVISFTDETSGRFDLWIIPAAELMTAIQQAAFAPSLDRGNAYNFNLQTDATADMIRQLNRDIRPYRRESGQTELTRAKFWPDDGPLRPGLKPMPIQTGAKMDVAARLAQWKIEATDPNHPNHYHANLDEPARIYAQISALLRKLRDQAEAFDRDDVAALFGALNSGKRMKNKVADGNSLPELRAALLALVDGEDEATAKIVTAASTIKFAHNNMLGELYGWANAETAPLYNSCARDALAYLGYPFDLADYNAFVAAHEQFKQVYLAQVGRLRPDLPLNLEIDKLYNVIDKVDLKQKRPALAKPFSEMFADWEEAEQAFDLLAEAAQRLGVTGPDDPLAAWTLRRATGQYHLHFTYGRWLVLGLAGANGHLTLKLALFRDRLDLPTTRIESFTQKEGETPVSLHYLAAQAWRQLGDSEQKVYGETLDYIKQLFADWQASPYHKYTSSLVAKAVFDSGARTRLLESGMEALVQRFWKIAPGDDAWQWDECRDDGFIAIGWDELGDLSDLDRAGFVTRRAEIQQKHPGWTNDALEQAWKFAQIQEGDRIVANRGTAEVLGIGTVTGQYYFVPGVRHGHRLPVQWDDTTARKVNEGGWRRTLVELTEAKFSALAAATPSVSVDDELVAHAESAFSPRAFQLLQGIHEQPTKAYYQTHKDEFKAEVVEPFQRVFRAVASRLPASIRASMETETDLFSIFPKNDYGRGGAWDFYWGAFYPKGGKRTQDAQLHASIRHDLLKFGFSMGAYGGAQRQRFQRNCQAHYEALVNLLPDVFADLRLVFGRVESITVTPAGQVVSAEACTWQEFLADPTRASSTAAVILPKAAVLRISAEALIADMVQTYERLFPLVLLATEDDPLPAIDRYLNPGSGSTLVGPEPPEPYDADHFLSITSLNLDDMVELREMLEDRRQIILYGPPGTGKTFVACELGKLLTGLTKPPSERLEIVQFHPAYSYEDFIEGIRPESKAGADGRYMIDYPTRPGVFQRFCQQAQSINGPCVFIIDEINRGNIPRIFGELMLLLEYRGLDVTLAYSGRRFRIPENIYLIGTMNTADRSIALVDFALRRRFHFFHFGADPDLLARWLEHNPVSVPYLLELYRRLSAEAIDDPDFAIGPSHFMRRDLTETQLRRIWRRNIEPYLKEYYVDQRERSKAERWEWDGALVKGIRQG